MPRKIVVTYVNVKLFEIRIDRSLPLGSFTSRVATREWQAHHYTSGRCGYRPACAGECPFNSDAGPYVGYYSSVNTHCFHVNFTVETVSTLPASWVVKSEEANLGSVSTSV